MRWILFIVVLFAGCLGENTDCLSYESPSMRDSCFKDKGDCESIRDEMQKVDCLKSIAKDMEDPSICEKIDGPQGDMCLFEIARSTENEGICQAMKDDYWMGECYYELGAKHGKLTCDKAGEKMMSCVRESISHRMDGEICSVIVDKSDECYNMAASLMNSTRSCEKIGNETISDNCISGVAGKLGKMQYCDLVVGQESRDRCKTLVAARIKDSSICAMLDLPQWKSECYDLVGRKLNDISICNLAQREGDKSQCISAIALSMKDSSICSNIGNKAGEETCLSQF